jgi:hypothetical protein
MTNRSTDGSVGKRMLAQPFGDVAAAIVRALLATRSGWMLTVLSLAIGGTYALSILPLSLVSGTGDFWAFPRGTVPGSTNDMAQVLTGYFSLMKAPWGWPVLLAPNLGVSPGTNIFWLDAVPWVSLSGKVLFGLTGLSVNLLGLYLFACFVLPGLAMTLLLMTAGQRSLMAALSGTIIANATPYLLYRWGHVATQGQYLILFGFVLYFAAIRAPASWRVSAAWLSLLTLAALTGMYLFVMVGALWSASVVQRRLISGVSTVRCAVEAAAIIGFVTTLMRLTGMLSSDLGGAGSSGFGSWSMN